MGKRFERDEIVTCVDDTFIDNLTVGKQYKVVFVDCLGMVHIDDDKGVKRSYSSTRFEHLVLEK